MKSLHRTPRILIASALLVLGAWFVVSRLTNTPQPAALAASLPTPSADTIVERWSGAIQNELFSNQYALECPSPWVCEGSAHRLDQQEWYLEVKGDGSVTGYIKDTILSYSYHQSRTNITCGPVSGSSWDIEDCVFTFQLSQPVGITLVKGKRDLDPFTHKPVLILSDQGQAQLCQFNWTARGIHSVTHALIQKGQSSTCNYSVGQSRSFNIVTFDDGRPPQIPMDYYSDGPTLKMAIVGHLTATTKEPLLTLDRELLERSIFLDQIPVQENFAAKMNWNSPNGGWVSWKLGDETTERIGPSDATEIPKPVNDGAQGVGLKQLTVQAQTTLKQTSRPETTLIRVAPPPKWAGSPSQISAIKVGGAVTYKNSLKFPDPPFEGEVDVPAIIPWLGGKKLGIKETQGSFAWEAQSTSGGQGSLAGQTGFEAMDGVVIGSLGGHAVVKLGPTGVTIPEGGMDFGIAGQLTSKPEPLLSVVPSLRPVLTALEQISPQAANFIKERAEAKLELAPRLDFGFNFLTKDDKIKFKSAEATPSFGFKTIAEIKLIKDILQATASIGGSISATFKVPATYFKEAALQGLVSAQVTLYRFAWEAQKSWSVVVSGASDVTAAASNSVNQLWSHDNDSGSWQLLPRAYLNMPNYARWHGSDARTQTVTQTPNDQLLVENVFPLAQPSIDTWASPSGYPISAIAWAHDKPGSPALSGGEIAVSMKSGDEWDGPYFLTDDQQDDLAPKVVILPSSYAMVLWQRLDTANPPDFNTDPAGYLSHLQVAARLLDTSEAQPLTQLSASGSLNYRYQIGRTDDGALAIWVNNPSNQLFGDASHPDSIIFSHYAYNADDDEVEWTPAAPVLPNIAGLVSLDLATNGQHGAIVYTIDSNGDLSTTTDQEIYYITWDGTTWSAPTRLTNDNIADQNPQLALDANGLPSLVWRQDGVLKFLQDGWHNAPTTIPPVSATDRPDFELKQGPDNQLTLVWQEVGPEDSRVGYSLYDAAHHHWLAKQSLTPPAGNEGSVANSIDAAILPGYDSADNNEDLGALLVTYQLAHIESITKTVDNVAIPNVPNIVQQDLRVASLPLKSNLTVTPADLSIPDATHIQAIIHNTGLAAVENVPVVLTVGSGDPVSGIAQKLSQTIPLLTAGSATTVTFTVADQKQSIFVVNIDPEQTLNESDTSDNSATLGTDIAITPLPTLYGPLGSAVRAQLTQSGNRYVSVIAPAILTLDAPDGPIVGGSQFGFPITRTDALTLTAFITPSLLGAGRHQLYWTVDPSDTLGESDRSNNIAGTSILVLPDLAAAGDSIHFGTAPGSSAPFQIGVQNLGNWPNATSTLEVYDGLPGIAGTHSLLQQSIPAIAPGGTATISATLPLTGLPAAIGGLTAIVIQLDPNDQIDESNENNNLISAGAILENVASEGKAPLYLPSILN